MEPVVVIGAGLAGVTVARELRRLRPHLPIVLVTSDDGHVYPKPQLSASLRLRREPEALIRTRAEALRAEGFTLLTRHFVTRIDPVAHAIELENGERLAYRALVLAVGASPVLPTFAGDAGHEVLTVNHLDDYRRFRERLRADLPVLLVGGGLIGTEFAADLAASGHGVHVVDPGSGPLSRLLPEAAGRALTQALASAGVTHHWGSTVDSLERAEAAGVVATLDDGTRLSVGTVLAAVGLRPNTGLAREAGLPVQRGIQVDAHLRVAPDIHALGDCAELPGGLLLPFIKPITTQARHIARAIAGEEDLPFTLENASVTVKVPQWPVVSSTPHPSECGRWDEEVSPTGTLSRLRDDEGRLWRIVATGDRVRDCRVGRVTGAGVSRGSAASEPSGAGWLFQGRWIISVLMVPDPGMACASWPIEGGFECPSSTSPRVSSWPMVAPPLRFTRRLSGPKTST